MMREKNSKEFGPQIRSFQENDLTLVIMTVMNGQPSVTTEKSFQENDETGTS